MSKFTPNKNVYQDMFNFEKNYWWYQGLRDTLNFYIKKFKPAKILDAGCGTGANMLELKKITSEIYGVDISAEAISIAKKNNLKNLYIGNLTKLPFENKKFNLIYCMDVFGNLNKEDTNKTLSEFNRCLEDEGIFMIQTAGFEGLTSAHDVYWDIQKRYRLEELEKIIIKNNFEIIKKSYRHFFLFPIIASIKLINKNKKIDSGDFMELPFLINYFLFLIMKLENFFLRYISFPIGSSVFIIAKKF